MLLRTEVVPALYKSQPSFDGYEGRLQLIVKRLLAQQVMLGVLVLPSL